MKKQKLNLQTLSFLLLAFSFLLTTSMQCKKDQTGIDALPPATQEGKETFGCLVNGEAFTPKGSSLGGPILSSFYQYLNTTTAKGFYFNVACNRRESGISRSISINGDSILIKEGITYLLKNYPNKNEINGKYAIVSGGGNINQYVTTNTFQGELFISKFDETKQIVSGTFWFDAVNDKDEKVEVREGRFDVHYVK
jgi:hypothetical protein